ncbi:MAG: aldehyde dehydrogenase family protein, partial [Pseudoflavonifractor sp.]
MDFTALISAQREYFNSGMTRGIALRLIALDKLEKAILAREGDLLAALKTDLGKAEYESYACEIGIVLSELRFAKKHLQKWATPQKRPSPLALFPAHSRVLAEPYGVVLIMSPWNYPVQLTLVPLVAALAAGNCALVKPS